VRGVREEQARRWREEMGEVRRAGGAWEVGEKRVDEVCEEGVEG